MVKKLTAGVLQGAEYTETIQVKWLEDTFEVEIKSLTNTQASEVQALTQEGVNIKGKAGRGGKMERVMNFDTTKSVLGRNKANIKAVAMGTTDKSITEKVVENEFPPKIVQEIAERVKEITGIKDEDEDENQVAEFNEGKENPSNSDRE